ncbi:transcriptional activator protein Pur-beta-like isoform X1 [Varroa jacobsoni]|uniref:transcriptional activator protein Pur-beta-like isoform X1 n=2 Tax=Varroa jacobsoni TaxID=62625 RepID=UPI000BF930D6|nr:transcriptional activator protein Pur-beta-like isoform X1 [Varroa jacobsoni]
MDSLDSAELNREDPHVVDDLDDDDLSDDGAAEGGGGGAEKELATKMLQIQSKRFYLDVKQNRRGRFIKVAEVGVAGRKSRLLLAMSTAAEFRDHLSSFSELYASLGPPNPENLPEDGKLRSEVMVKENRRYYLDLKENSRGRFLRVSQTIATVSARAGPRTQIAIPAQGMIEFRDALTDLLEEYGTDDGGFKGDLPEGRHLRVEDKTFYFDIGQNSRGIYMRVSEVKNNFRSAITIPERSWSKFRDMFADYVARMDAAQEKSAALNEQSLQQSTAPGPPGPSSVSNALPGLTGLSSTMTNVAVSSPSGLGSGAGGGMSGAIGPVGGSIGGVGGLGGGSSRTMGLAGGLGSLGNMSSVSPMGGSLSGPGGLGGHHGHSGHPGGHSGHGPPPNASE